MLTIDSSKVKGEPGTGYEAPDGKGPFECGNCEYFRRSDSSCGQETMMARSKQPRLDKGITSSSRVKVDEHGCCEYIHRIGSSEGGDSGLAMLTMANAKQKFAAQTKARKKK